MLIAELSHAPQIVCRVEMHAARALHDRLEDHRRELVLVLAQHRRKLLDVLLSTRLPEERSWARREEMLREHAAKHLGMHAIDRVAHGHRTERVAVVAAAHRQQARAPLDAARAPVL